jgi:hypothetical protein
MTVGQARQRLISLLEENDGTLSADVIEADPDLDRHRQVVSAAARQLATDPGISTGLDSNGSQWFPYSSVSRALVSPE